MDEIGPGRRTPSGTSEQKREEQKLFEAFKARQGFSCDEWYPEHDPPDVIYPDASGRSVGVEICQWAHQGQMKAGKLRETFVKKIQDAIGKPQPVNNSKTFGWPYTFRNPKVASRRTKALSLEIPCSG